MEEYEQLQKFFQEKEKENLRLKQELNNLKEKLSDDNSENSRISNKEKLNKSNKESEKGIEVKELEISPDKANPPSPDLNLKRDNTKKESTFFHKESNINGSFLSINDTKNNKNIFNTLKSNVVNYRRNSALFDKNVNFAPVNATSRAVNYAKSPSNLILLKNNMGDVSNLKSSGFNNVGIFNQNLNVTQINDKNYGNYHLENDEKLNMLLLNKVKSSTNLPNFYRSNSILNASNIQKISENYYTNMNQTGFIFAETPIREHINENNISSIKEGKSLYLNLGRLYDERDMDRSKSPKLVSQNNISHLSMNKGVIKNIESNITELKSQLINYEKAYESINSRLDNNVDVTKVTQLEAKINDLNNLLKLKEEEKKHIQELYTNEMKNKLEINNQTILNLRNSHMEEIRNLKSDFEKQIENIQKKFDEEKNEYKNSIMNLEKELIITNKKNDLNEKAEIIEFQKKYLTEMRELQKSFEEFKVKTYEEMKILRKQKDEAIKKSNLYQQHFERIKLDWEQNENIYRENYRSMKNKLDSFKIFIKNNEILKNQLDLSKSEISFLKLKVSKLESSEKNLHNILLEKSMGGNMNPNFSQTNNFSDGFYGTEKSNYYQNKSDYMNYDLNVNYQGMPNPFSPVMGNNSQPKRSNSKSMSSNPRNTGGYYSSRESDLNYLEENNNKFIDLKKAQIRIREMEEYLKSMNFENDDMRGKLGNVISHLSTPQDPNKIEDVSNENNKPKTKKKNFSSVNNNTLEDLRNKFKYSNNYNNADFLSHYKSNSMIPNENEEIEQSDTNTQNNFENNEYLTNNLNVNNVQQLETKRTRDVTPNTLRWNRNLTLGKSGQNHILGNSEDASNNPENEENFNIRGSSNNLINENNLNNNIFKINPFVDNTSTYMHNDFENINDKISNLDNIEDNSNNLEEIEQMENEDDSDNYNVVEFPLQLKMKNKKKMNKI